MIRHRLFSIFLAISLVVLPTAFAQKENDGNSISPNIATGPGLRVRVESVAKVLVTKDSHAYSIIYQYEFSNRQNIYIKGLGIVPAKGSFEYFSKDQYLEFQDPSSKAVILKLPLKETVIVAQHPPLNEIPSEDKFPLGFRSYSWNSQSSLQDRANTVLRKYFHYLPYDNNNVTNLATTFAPLQVEKLRSGTFAQLALLISFPFDPTTGKYSFHVKSMVMEGRTHSDDVRETRNPDIIKAADDFVDNLVNEMQTGG